MNLYLFFNFEIWEDETEDSYKVQSIHNIRFLLPGFTYIIMHDSRYIIVYKAKLGISTSSTIDNIDYVVYIIYGSTGASKDSDYKVHLL